MVLSEYDNFANGATFGDGFSQTGMGNFTAGEFGCSASAPFCDTGVDQRNGNWAVDLDGASAAQEISGTPEPGTVLLLSAGLAGLALLRRRKQG